MDEQELYRKKKQAQLDEWKAELDKIKGRAEKADAETRLKVDEKAKELETKIEEGQDKLNKLEDASGDAWKSLKDVIDSAWESLKTGFADAASKFNK